MGYRIKPMKAAFRKLGQDEYEKGLQDAELLEQDTFGPKVYELSDGRILKLFRIRRRFSSNLYLPYAKRFARNAERLAARGFSTISVESWGRVPHLRRQFALYAKLPGQTLRKLPSFDGQCLGRVLAKLHASGVLFRSCHLGNWVLTPEGSLGLIDLTDLSFFPWALTKSQRSRNFLHLTRKGREAVLLRNHWDSILAGYAQESGLCAEVVETIAARART